MMALPVAEPYRTLTEPRENGGHAREGKILVTGAAGFVGRHLVRELRRQGAEVLAIDNLCIPPIEPPPEGLRQVSVLDLTAEDLNGVSCIYHLAAWKSVPESFTRPDRCVENIYAGERILRTALSAGAARIVIASSCEVYGAAALPTAEDAPLAPRSAYAMAKASVDCLAAICQQMRQDVVIARLFNIYGPGERPDAVIPAFCHGAIAKGEVSIEGTGEQRRDFCYITDTVARLIELSVLNDLPGVVNMGSGESHSVLELASRLAKMRPGTAITFGPSRPREIDEFRADMALGNKLFSTRDLVEIDTGLAETFSWWEWHADHA